MKLGYPSFYKEFRCTAGACPDSCCKDWDVEVDAESEARYRSLNTELGALLRQHLYEEEGHTYLAFPKGRCPVQRGDGLCRLQAELGESALCATCREFPRIVQDYGDFQEHLLELSCPEAARLLLEQTHLTLVEEEAPGTDQGDYDREALDILRRRRPQLMAMLENGACPVNQRLALLLLWGYQLQGEVDGAEPMDFDMEEGLKTLKALEGAGDARALLDFFSELEILTPRWKALLEDPNPQPHWFPQLALVAEYGLYRYLYQSVSDYDVVGRVKLVVTGCIVMALLGGETAQRRQEAVYRYSREIENDAENVDAILDGGYTHPALTDRNLLGLLLG